MSSTSSQLPEKQWIRSYYMELGAVLGLYAIVLVVVNVISPYVHGGWQYLVVLAPMIPFAGIFWAMARLHARIDEMQKAQSLRAFVFAFSGTAIITFAYGFEEQVGVPHISMFFVFPVMMVLYLSSLFFQRARGLPSR